MKTLRFLHRELLQIILLALPFALAAAWWNKIPPVVATHWGLHGQPDGWMSKGPGLLLPAVLNVALCLFMVYLPDIVPRPGSNPAVDSARYRRILRIYRYAITTLICQVALAVIAVAAGWRINIELIAVNGLLALFLVVGNYLGSLPPNRLVGRRTPWTPQDDGVWRATNRTTGRLLVFGALALLIAEFFVARETHLYLLMAYVAGIAVWSLGSAVWLLQRRRLA